MGEGVWAEADVRIVAVPAASSTWAPNEADFPTAMAVRHDQPYAAWVTIQVGCNNSCAFCIVPAVRGPEVSRPFGELVEGVLVAGRREQAAHLGPQRIRRAVDRNGDAQDP